MSHTIYTTPGIIIGAQYHGKANRRFTVLTRDLGLISITAQGVRELVSKLRFHMQIFNHCEIDCLEGKEGWRLVGADTYRDGIPAPHQLFQPLYARLFRLIRRLVVGEEARDERLYRWIQELYIFTNRIDQELTNTQMATLEMIAIGRTMHVLGYLDNPSLLQSALTMDMVDAFSTKREQLVRMINEALHASQL